MAGHAHCDSCKFFDEHKVNGAQASGEEGLCRYNPPVTQPSAEAHGLWPVVSSDDWCGHFSNDRSGGTAD